MLTVLIPVYNEEGAIGTTVREIDGCLAAAFPDKGYEVLVINDGSTDGTAERLHELTGDRLRVLTLPRNRGYGAALKAGLRRAQYDHVAITDADGTYPNRRIPELFRHYRDHDLDMLVGSRTAPGAKTPALRRPAKAILRHFAAYLTKQEIPDLNSGLRIFRKDFALKFYAMYPDGFSLTTTMTMAALSNDYQVEFVPIGYDVRHGASKIKPVRDTANFVLLIIRMTMYFHPLRVFLPATAVLGLMFLGLLFTDVFIIKDITQRTLLLGMVTGLTFALGLIADAVAKRA